MRLTLRTILAYLDDVLEPADARQIGEKIAQSKEASALVLRIQETIRRRRVGAPELTGPGSGPDPNLVANYLENAMPPGQVVELERLCQNSDIHLAEVAACHKILTMVMGQSIDVSDDVLERMYALAPQPGRPAATAIGSSEPAMTDGLENSRVENAVSGLPEYLTRRTDGKKWLVMATVALVAIGWLGLIATDHGLWSQPDVTPVVTNQSETGSLAQTDVTSPASQIASNDPSRLPLQSSVQPMPPAVDSAIIELNQLPELPVSELLDPMEQLASGFDDELMMAESEDEADMVPTEDDSENLTNSAIASADQENQTPTPPAPGLKLPVVFAETEPELAVRWNDGVIIRRRTPAAPWRLLESSTSTGEQAAALVQLEDEIASPVPYITELEIPQQFAITLNSGSRMTRVRRPEGVSLSLTLDRGQFVFQREQTAQSPIVLQLEIASKIWKLTFLDPGSRCGVEVVLPDPHGPPGSMGALMTEGGIVVESGNIIVEIEGQQQVHLTSTSGFLPWPSAGEQMMPRAGAGLPFWLHPSQVFVSPTVKQLAKQYQRELQTERDLVPVLGPLSEDRRPSMSLVAVQTLGLIDQYQYLVPALNSEHQETRLASMQGLREWLPRHPNHQDLLTEELTRSFSQNEVSPLQRLLWGFAPTDAANPVISRQLVDWLADEQIAVREMAFYHLVQLTGKRYDFLPMAPASERRAAIQRWEDHLRKNDGVLLPR